MKSEAIAVSSRFRRRYLKCSRASSVDRCSPFFGACLAFYLGAITLVAIPSTPTLARRKPEKVRLNKVAEFNGPNGNAERDASTVFQEAEKLRTEQREVTNQEAVNKYREAAELFRSVDDLEHETRALRSAGEVLQVLGNTRSALACYNEALQLSRKIKSRLEEGKLLNDIAYAQFLDGNTNAARRNSLAAVQVAKAINDQRLKAQGLSTLGEAFYNLGDLAIAEKYQQQALKIWTEVGDQSGKALASVALGYYKSFLGEPTEAVALFNQAVSAAAAANDVRHQALALNGLGNVAAKLGYKQEALDAYTKARELAERIGDRICLASILAGEGSLHFWLGDAKTALIYLEEAVPIFEQIDQQWGIAETKLMLGQVRHSLGDYPKALSALTEALAVFKALQMSRLEAHTLREIGSVQTSMGDIQAALRSFEQVLRLNRFGQDQRHEAYTLTYIGKAYEALGDSKQALRHFERALELSRIAADPAGESNALLGLARVQRNRGNLISAQQSLQSAIAINESVRTKVASQDLRASFLASVRGSYELYIDVLMLRDMAKRQPSVVAEAFAISEKARARSLFESLQESGTNVREGVEPGLLSKERELSQKLNETAQQHIQALARKDAAQADKLNREIDSLSAEYSSVQNQIRASSPQYAALSFPEPLNLSEVQQNILSEDSVLLEYALGDERSYVWVVTRSTISGYQLPSRAEIEGSALRLRNLYVAQQAVPGESVEQRDERQAKVAGAMPAETELLSKLILKPLSATLGDRRLLIVADGALQYVPFHVLNDPDSQATQPLIAKHEIVYEPSASTLAVMWKEANRRKAAPNTIAVFADPVFEVDDPRVKRALDASTPETEESKKVRQALRDIGLSADGVQIPRLLASRQEAEAILNSAPWGGLKAVGFEANRQRVLKGNLADYAVVHFATHGLINSEHPELSGIVLSLFDEQGHSQDGFLRLHDIYNLRLPADLVVLSACSTGLGKDVKGEGLIGLTRGFMYAGASSVVASLWKVDDDATAELMKRFYQAMFSKGLTPAAALREAQLTMSRHERWHAPYYWAGFVIQGRYDQHVAATNFKVFTPTHIATAVTVVGLLLTSLFVFLRRRRT